MGTRGKKAANKGGRPTVAAKRDALTMLRFTADELALLKEAASGFPVSTWIRVEIVRLAAARVKGGRA
jgi:hypothetical protein